MQKIVLRGEKAHSLTKLLKSPEELIMTQGNILKYLLDLKDLIKFDDSWFKDLSHLMK